MQFLNEHFYFCLKNELCFLCGVDSIKFKDNIQSVKMVLFLSHKEKVFLLSQ